MHAMKASSGAAVYLNAFLTPAVDGVCLQLHSPTNLPLGKVHHNSSTGRFGVLQASLGVS